MAGVSIWGSLPRTVPLGHRPYTTPLRYSSFKAVVLFGSCGRRRFYLIQGPLGALGGWAPPDAQGGLHYGLELPASRVEAKSSPYVRLITIRHLPQTA